MMRTWSRASGKPLTSLTMVESQVCGCLEAMADHGRYLQHPVTGQGCFALYSTCATTPYAVAIIYG